MVIDKFVSFFSFLFLFIYDCKFCEGRMGIRYPSCLFLKRFQYKPFLVSVLVNEGYSMGFAETSEYIDSRSRPGPFALRPDTSTESDLAYH